MAWFLSCTMIFYMLTPFLLSLSHKISRKKNMAFLFYLLNLGAFGICYMIFRDLQYYRFPELQLSLVYSTVYIRIFSYLAGILSFIIREELRTENYRISKLEIPLVIISVLWWLLAGGIPLPMVFQELISLILSSLLIIVFSFDAGIVKPKIPDHFWWYKFRILFDSLPCDKYMCRFVYIYSDNRCISWSY